MGRSQQGGVRPRETSEERSEARHGARSVAMPQSAGGHGIDTGGATPHLARPEASHSTACLARGGGSSLANLPTRSLGLYLGRFLN